MDTDKILIQEGGNDGQSIFLYYDAMAGVYTAYGLSAYYTTLVSEPRVSYSEALQKPVALLWREHVLSLRQSLEKVEHTQKSFYRFRMRVPIGDAGYGRWAEKVLERHNG
ncbi:MAG: hypothetical protein K2I86_02875 [Prevotella sp.]|nr:hypothetical protein [Prevotella sp.]